MDMILPITIKILKNEPIFHMVLMLQELYEQSQIMVLV